MGRTNNPDVHRYFHAPSDSLDGSFLNEAKQFGLQWKRQITDFIKHQGATVCGFDFPKRHLGGTREGPFFVSKQFALKEVFRYRRAIDCNEPACTSGGQLVQAACQHLFAGAALTQQHDRGIAAGHLLYSATNTQHLGIARHQARQRIRLMQRLKPAVLTLQFKQPEGAAHRQVQQFRLKWFRKEIISAQCNGPQSIGLVILSG